MPFKNSDVLSNVNSSALLSQNPKQIILDRQFYVTKKFLMFVMKASYRHINIL